MYWLKLLTIIVDQIIYNNRMLSHDALHFTMFQTSFVCMYHKSFFNYFYEVKINKITKNSWISLFCFVWKYHLSICYVTCQKIQHSKWKQSIFTSMQNTKYITYFYWLLPHLNWDKKCFIRKFCGTSHRYNLSVHFSSGCDSYFISKI